VLRIQKLVAVISALFLVACGNTATDSNVAQKSLQDITIAQYGHVFVYMPLYVAVDQGFFKDEGLNVKLVSTGGDEKTFAAVASGNAQFGVSDPVFTAIARERGQGGKVVAAVVKGVPLSVVSFKDVKPFREAAGFKGDRIATYSAPSTSYTVMMQMLKNNGHPVNAKVVQGAFGTLQAMVKSDQADMALEIEPMVSSAVADHGHIVFEVNGKFPEFAFTGLMVSDQYRQEHADQVQAAVNALSRGLKFLQTNPDGAAEIAKKEFPELPEGVVKAALTHLMNEGNVPKTAVLDKKAWDNAVKLRQEAGDLKGSGSYEENVDVSFASKAQSL
jgi:NitT/TauT family transport system substrate-binding protein